MGIDLIMQTSSPHLVRGDGKDDAHAVGMCHANHLWGWRVDRGDCGDAVPRHVSPRRVLVRVNVEHEQLLFGERRQQGLALPGISTVTALGCNSNGEKRNSTQTDQVMEGTVGPRFGWLFRA